MNTFNDSLTMVNIVLILIVLFSIILTHPKRMSLIEKSMGTEAFVQAAQEELLDVAVKNPILYAHIMESLEELAS